jgi:hypothetical protein
MQSANKRNKIDPNNTMTHAKALVLGGSLNKFNDLLASPNKRRNLFNMNGRTKEGHREIVLINNLL